MNDTDEQKIVFDTSFVKQFLKTVSFSAIIDQLAKNLLNKDLVTLDYPQAVKDREVKFPTGLPTTPIGVAIPHTDPQYVKINAVSVGILKEPIEMTVMGTEDEKVQVSIIFLLSLAHSNKQLNILQRIMSVVQNQELLQKLLTMGDEEVAVKVQNAILEGLS